MSKRGKQTEDDRTARPVLEQLRKHRKVLEMRNYTQHGRISTYEHCERVAAFSGRINRRLHLNADEDTLLTGAMLHDFYLYDWHNKDGGSHNLHGYIHADRALENARRYFHVDEKTAHVIRCHMWPLNITRLPRSREAWIVCIADKCVSVKETLFER
ncbi:MAG: HD domain-containing protein [Lachnospiraceae bacterium]|nr:HD domain-containing protein [Lachnospiraceae bacterium]